MRDKFEMDDPRYFTLENYLDDDGKDPSGEVPPANYGDIQDDGFPYIWHGDIVRVVDNKRLLKVDICYDIFDNVGQIQGMIIEEDTSKAHEARNGIYDASPVRLVRISKAERVGTGVPEMKYAKGDIVTDEAAKQQVIISEIEYHSTGCNAYRVYRLGEKDGVPFKVYILSPTYATGEPTRLNIDEAELDDTIGGWVDETKLEPISK